MADGTSAKDVILGNVVPALGAVISTVMYASPLRAVLRADKEKVLGDLNPFPLAITVINTIVWLAYGLLKQDPYVTTPNVPGIGLSMFMTLTAYGLADDKGRNRLRLVLTPALVLLAVLGVVTAFAMDTRALRLGVWGIAGNCIALIYYAAPLSSMWDVIRLRNSASILLPLTIMNTTNAGLWTTYGLAVGDYYVWVPNGIGLLLSVAQLVLRAVFPAKARYHGASGSSTLSAAAEPSWSLGREGQEGHHPLPSDPQDDVAAVCSVTVNMSRQGSAPVRRGSAGDKSTTDTTTAAASLQAGASTAAAASERSELLPCGP